jgi:hypothetical protein
MEVQTRMPTQVSRRGLEQRIPPAFRPVIRAYVLGYASSTAPRLLTLLLTHLSRRRKNIDEKPEELFFPAFFRILRGGLEIQRFPTFCAALVGGSTFLEARDRQTRRSWTSLTRFRFRSDSYLLVWRLRYRRQPD